MMRRLRSWLLLAAIPLGLSACASRMTMSAAEEGPRDPLEVRAITRAGRVQPPPSPGPMPVNPHDKVLWRRAQLVDEHDQIPPGAYERALAHREANIAHWTAMGAMRDAGIAPHAWTERGPNNVGGRTRSLLIHPTQPNRMWCGSVSGGIWYSSNGGTTWTPVDDRLQNLAIGHLAFDPQNPDIIYAGTGEGYFNSDAIVGMGIYRSTDSGVSWHLMPSTAGWDNVCRIAISPADSNLIIASRRYGGIFRSTNGGETWTNVRPAQGSYQVLFNPVDPTRLVGHIIDHDGQTWYHRAVSSTDSGQTWQNAASGLTRLDGFNSRIELAYAPSSPNIVYANAGAGNGQVWRSTDHGQTYTLRTTSGGTGSGWYYNAIWVDPTNPEFILTGGYDIKKSTSGGQSLTRISDGYLLTQAPHPDIHLFVQDPGFNGSTNRRVYVCTDGGVHRTDNIYTAADTTGWVSLQPTFRTTQFYGAQGDGPSGRIVGGTQDNGTLRLNTGSNTAVLTFGGDGGWCAIDRTNPNYLYGEYIRLQIVRSTNGGSSANYIYQGISDAGTSNANFIAPFILDPNNQAVLLAGGRSLWRTSNARASTVQWSSISSPWSSNISAIAVAPGNSNIIWIGLNNGRVYRTSNGAAASPTWLTVDDNGSTNPLPNRYITRIVIDDDDHNTVYISLGGYSPGNLRRTRDNGLTWQDITGAGPTGLPEAPIRGVARHPHDPDRLYVGTEVGIFASGNGGADWSTSNQGPASVSVDELTFMHNSTTLLAATHGRGLWTIAVRTCTADWDGVGGVNSTDIAAFITSWLASIAAGDLSADFNGDMTVNSADISAFISAWLEQINQPC